MESNSFFKVYNASAGSGKTFTLVKEYLKVLFNKSDFEFQKILAITFTNKAAAEMKQRVLSTLQDASRGIENPIIQDIVVESKINVQELTEKSKRVLNNILQNYASFNIVTIDSFTHKLIRTFALDLGLPLDFEVEMDVDLLLNETVDVLISKIGQKKDLTDYLVKYTLEKVNNDKSWSINEGLVDVAKLLLNEENEIEVSKLVNTPLSDFKDLEKKLKNYLVEVENTLKEIGVKAISIIDERSVAHNSFTSSAIPNYFKKLIKGWSVKEEPLAIKTVQKCFDTESYYPKSKPKSSEQEEDRFVIDELAPLLISLFHQSQAYYQIHFGQYFLVKKILKTVVPLAVLNYINKELIRLKEENNIRLNAEFNQLISKEIKDQPVPFIYERLGEKFNYFFVDEMQDTSELQWQNLIPLIQNALSQNIGGLMLVGDAKQSIYRWRGGKAEQFVSLSDAEKDEYNFFVKKEVHRLDTNYRSYSNVINFNNSFFGYLSNSLKNSDYKSIYAAEKNQKTNSKEGGFVSIEVCQQEKDFDKHDFYPKKTIKLIKEIEENGFSKGEICILIRDRVQGEAVTNALMLEGINVISPDNLLLKNNISVKFLMFLLKWIDNTENKTYLFEVLPFLYHHLNIKEDPHIFYETCLSKLATEELFKYLGVSFSIAHFFENSLYDGVESLIRVFKLQSYADIFVQAFLDVVLNFQLKESSTLQVFLVYWEKKKNSLKVEAAADKDAVQLMTIHKSKGLEFPVVIFLYDLDTEDIKKESIWFPAKGRELFKGFNSFQFKASKNLSNYGEKGEEIYLNTLEENQLDNFNLLYVALTRAEEQLYVVCDTDGKVKGEFKKFSHYFLDFINQEAQGDNKYIIGSPKRISAEYTQEVSLVFDEFISVDKQENQIQIVEKQQKNKEAIDYGNLIHLALEKVISILDLQKGLDFIDHSNLEDSVKVVAKESVVKIVAHPLLNSFFKEGAEVYNERSLLDQYGRVNIIDKLLIEKSGVSVLDFKTGEKSASHQVQINQYARLLEDLGYTVKNKFVVYCSEISVKRVK